MAIGNKLLELRKKAGLSQEEAAFKLNVSRQTISKWETNQSTPDFDKLSLICALYNISADELINETCKEKQKEVKDGIMGNRKKRALGIGIGIFLYFLAVIEIMIIPLSILNPIVGSAIFLAICGLATGFIVYVCLIYKVPKEETKKNIENPIVKQVNEIIAIIILIIYLLVSFITRAWYITWILWIIYALIREIVKLIFTLKGVKKDEKS